MRNKYMAVMEEKCGKARVSDVDASYKELCAVCDNVRGKPTDTAIAFLEEAVEGKKAVYFRTHNTKMGHRRQLGGKKGRFPKKAARIVLGVVKAAFADAERKGLFNTYVFHIAANKKRMFPRTSAKGKPMMWKYETSFVESILAEKTGEMELQDKAKEKAKEKKEEMKTLKAKKK